MSKCRSGRRADRRAPRAPGRSDGTRAPRSAGPCPRSTGNNAGPALRSLRRIAANGRSSNSMIACVRALVRVIAQRICGFRTPSSSDDMVQSCSSLGCSTSRAQSMVRPSSRGGVPVFNRPWPRPTSRIWPANATEPRSPRRPPSTTSSPTNMRASRNVPVAITTARHGSVPTAVSIPAIRPPRITRLRASPTINSTPLFASKSPIAARYKRRSA